MSNQGKNFLSTVAEKIVQKEKDNFQNVLVLFPNRRAIRFFNRYVYENINSYLLKEEKQTPIFTCEAQSIKELVSNSLKDMQEGETLQLLYLLYTVYCDVMGTEGQDNPAESLETFDDFYSFGNILLNDFDQIDKELVDAKALFRNMQDYKDLEADPHGYLSSEQIELINRLFNTTLAVNNSSQNEKESSMRRNFAQIWNNLYTVYENYNALLDSEGLAYSGKMYREFAKRLENDDIVLPVKRIKVVGFSVLNNAEQKVFRLLKEKYVVDFYWDYDEYYVKDESNEAGIFMRENLRLYPQSEDLKDLSVNNISYEQQEINIVSSSYETTSLAYITKWLDEVIKRKRDNGEECVDLSDVAIILNDESIVPLVIKSLPKEYADKINITMGYPLNQTWLYNEVTEKLNRLADENRFTQEYVFEELKLLAQTIQKDNERKNDWQISALKKICTSVSDFIATLDSLQLTNLSSDIIKNVLRQSLQSLNLDIVSDGLQGVQLMGMLETRALNFDYILMLSCNDDKLPNISQDTSFIPYSFRKAYQMMNADRKAGVFAYYFYRLLHQAKKADYVFTTVGGENKLKEKSRFIRQIEMEFPLIKTTKKIIKQKNLTTVKALRPQQREYYFDKKDIENILLMKQKLSPSALNNLIHCEQKFYLNNLRYLREDIDDEQYLAIAFGNVFHNSANLFYEKLNQSTDSSPDIDKLINDSIEQYIAKEESAKERRVCGDKIHLNMIKKYLKDVYLLDCKENVEYICGERVCSHVLEIGDNKVVLEGRLDRMDCITLKDGRKVLRILDYKTGTDKDKRIHSLEEIFFNPEETKPRKYGLNNIFEVLFYCYLVYNSDNCDWLPSSVVSHSPNDVSHSPSVASRSSNVALIKPELMYLNQLDKRDLFFASAKTADDTVIFYNEELNAEFERLLKQLINSLLQKRQGEKYNAVMSEEKCAFCDYKLLCTLGKEQNAS